MSNQRFRRGTETYASDGGGALPVWRQRAAARERRAVSLTGSPRARRRGHQEEAKLVRASTTQEAAFGRASASSAASAQAAGIIGEEALPSDRAMRGQPRLDSAGGARSRAPARRVYLVRDMTVGRYGKQRMAVQTMDGAGISLHDLLRRLLPWWWLLLLGLLLGAAAGYGYASLQTPVYAAQATMLIGTSQNDGSFNSSAVEAGALLAKTYAQLAKSESVLRPVIAGQGLSETAAQLSAKITTRTIADLQILEISVVDPESERAATLANAVVDSLAQRIQEQANQANQQTQAALAARAAEIQAQIAEADQRFQELAVAPEAAQPSGQAQLDAARSTRDRLQASLDALNTAASSWDVSAASAGSRVTVWSRAAVPTTPVRPRTLLLVLLGGLLGAMAVSGLLIIRAFVDAEPEIGASPRRGSRSGVATPS